jgi:hypothetical protein
MPPSGSSAIPVSAPPATVPRDWVHGTNVNDPIGSAETNPVAFAAEPATNMFDPFRTAASGVIVEKRRPKPEEEFAE